MDNQVLSQDEIDALLGDSDQDFGAFSDGEIHAYDFNVQDKVIRSRMPSLEMICERLVRSLRISFFNIYRKTPEVSFAGIELLKYIDYVHTMYVPTSLNLVKIKPLRGTSLITLDSKLVFVLVENYFGGSGRFYTKIEGRDFTNTELKLIQKVTDSIFSDLKNAWKPVMEVEFDRQGHEMNPSMANIVAPSEIVIICKFDVEMNNQGGQIHLTMPYSMIEPIKELLTSHIQVDQDKQDERWVKSLKKEVFKSLIEVNLQFAQKEITLKDLSELKKGDVIELDVPNTLTLSAAGVPLFLCKFGNHDGKYSVKIINNCQDDGDYI
jgi:flagellar motor switch protein FliM